MNKAILVLLLLGTCAKVFSQESLTNLVDTTNTQLPQNTSILIDEIEVKARLKDANLLSGSTGISVNVSEIKQLPNLIGESDPYKALHYYGGISQTGEGSSGLYVRGGNNDQNLILLNGVIIQNPTHVLGMFSVFNPDIIEKMRFIKSGIPAEYGGRLSSVIDIGTLNNRIDELRIDGAVGLISSRVAVQAPISNSISAYGSFRGSYLNSFVLPALSKLGVDSTITRNQYSYLDANAGLIFNLSQKSKITAHLYYGEDKIIIKEVRKYNFKDNNISWNNKAANIQFNHLFNQNLSMNHQIAYSGFSIGTQLTWSNSSFNFQSKLDNYSYIADFFLNKNNHQLKFGAEANLGISNPHFVKADSLFPMELNYEHNIVKTSQLTAYFRDEWTFSRFQINTGVRANIFSHLGPFTDYLSENQYSYPKNKRIKNYYGIEPRLYIRYLVDENSSIKTAATHHIQYLNQIPMISLGIPIDLQMPSGLHVKPQNSWHFSGGYFRNFNNNNFESGVEIYYKTLGNQLEFTSGLIGTFTNQMLEKNLLTGQGWAYGIEFQFRKTAGKLSAWLSYNLAWSFRQFDQLNDGQPYLAKNDRRHDLSVLAIYKLNPRWTFTAQFVYATGSRLNLPLSWFVINNKIILEYGKYNAFEMPPFHRLDLSATYKLKQRNRFNSEIIFSVYNAYNRANPFQVFYNTESYYLANNSYDFSIGMAYLLPVIPSVSWVFHFN